MCHNFSVQRFHMDTGETKFLMFFDGCATHLGCTVLLRGGSSSELKRIKKIMQHLILVNYSWRQEKSFLMDEFAMPSLLSDGTAHENVDTEELDLR
jgi:1-phosphatidylinositol-3-phosphate 5-kinase